MWGVCFLLMDISENTHMKTIIVLLALVAMSFSNITQAQTQTSTYVELSGVREAANHWAGGPKVKIVQDVGKRRIKWSMSGISNATATAEIILCAYDLAYRTNITGSLIRSGYTNSWCQKITMGTSLANGSLDWVPEIPKGLDASYYRIMAVFKNPDGTTVTNLTPKFGIYKAKRSIMIESPLSASLPHGGGSIPINWTSKGIPPNAWMEARLTSLLYPDSYATISRDPNGDDGRFSNTGGQLLTIPDYLPAGLYAIHIVYLDSLGNVGAESQRIPFTVTATIVPQQE